MDFVCIDFEVANNMNRSSVCALGIVEVKNGEIFKEEYLLIKPTDMYFDPYCVNIHGITPEDVADKPSFEEIWKDISRMFDGSLVIAHNASYDMSVLRHSLDEINVEYPSLFYNCTKNIAKKTWSGLPSYSLDVVARHLNITFKHHHALEDARTAAQVYLNACNYNEVVSHDGLIDKLKVVQGSLFSNGYSPARIREKKVSKRIDISELVAAATELDEDHPFYGATCAFTGTLQSMARKDAMQLVIDRGGDCTNGINKKTNYLIMGDQDFARFTDGKKSTKLKKAEDLIKDGQELEIISEQDFISLL
ncbi:hypothetical protein BKP37_00580 [Anaerobacillus alkalilacustris]|uniref:BRCT domain-containing protein n=1 Tax=Anaerobacillus alkalilacustris TaxID=393763 RepID=A0A1S2LXW1_9BACI|nr:exonuclease domain-containing protein [Anaerobacillus alkalilacustris]OIJ17070.1 hypothetical protein BKP37_00580 [Anaerobacillus alkalilacustris]